MIELPMWNCICGFQHAQDIYLIMKGHGMVADSPLERTYKIETRPLPFDHPFQVTIYLDGEIEAGFLGFSVPECKGIAEDWIAAKESPDA